MSIPVINECFIEVLEMKAVKIGEVLVDKNSNNTWPTYTTDSRCRYSIYRPWKFETRSKNSNDWQNDYKTFNR